MAARVETKFTADTRDIERRLAQLDTRMDKFANRAANSMSAVQRNVNNLDQSTARLGRTLTTMAGTFAAAFSIQQAVALADTFTQFEAKLINANVAAGDMAKTQEKLFAIAKANGSEIVALADLYGAMSMSAQSLGLSQADIMTATEGVSAAMRVSGATTAQASATILQLGQALAGGTVRAEEYNSMLENSPALVRAVADASTKWGGDLGKLRKEINDGKVSSQEWAQAILAASDVLVSKAAKAPLTVAASLQNLRTSMVEYIGQADASLGATDKLSFALKLLGENIDTVAGAIAIVGSVIVSRGVGSLAAYTGSAIAAQVATARLTMFQATMTASMTGVSRSALMATTAMTGLNASMAFLGGPIGIAITAIAVAVMGLSSAAKTAQRETGEFTDAISESNRVLKEASEINRSVADMTKSFGSESAGAVAGVLGLCDATGKLADETFRLADAQQEAARTAILDRIAKNRVEIAERENPGFWTKVGEAAGMKYTEGPNRGRYAGDVRKEEARVLESQNTDLMAAAIQMGVGPGARWTNALRTRASSAGGTTPSKKTGRGGSSGPSAEDVARSSADVGRQYEREIAQIEADLLGTAQARHDLALQRLDWERDDNLRAVERQQADKQITDAAAESAKTAIATAHTKSVELENANRARSIEEARISAMAEQAQYEDNIARILDANHPTNGLIATNSRLSTAEVEIGKRALSSTVTSLGGEISTERGRINGALNRLDSVELEVDDKATIQSVSNLSGELNTERGRITSTNTRLDQVKITADGAATATSVNALSQTVSGQTNSITSALSLATDANNRSNAVIGLTSTVAGVVTGFTSVNDGTKTAFKIQSDKFELVPSTGSGARTEFSAGAWKIYDASNRKRIHLGLS